VGSCLRPWGAMRRGVSPLHVGASTGSRTRWVMMHSSRVPGTRCTRSTRSERHHAGNSPLRVRGVRFTPVRHRFTLSIMLHPEDCTHTAVVVHDETTGINAGAQIETPKLLTSPVPLLSATIRAAVREVLTRLHEENKLV